MKRTVGEADFSSVFGTWHELPMREPGGQTADASVWHELAILLLAARHHYSSDQANFSSHASHVAIDPLFAYSTNAALYARVFHCLSGQCGSLEAQCLSAVCVQWAFRLPSSC